MKKIIKLLVNGLVIKKPRKNYERSRKVLNDNKSKIPILLYEEVICLDEGSFPYLPSVQNQKNFHPHRRFYLNSS
jgi:hypothetical protein